jgi:hypothetical protein
MGESKLRYDIRGLLVLVGLVGGVRRARKHLNRAIVGDKEAGGVFG